MRKEKENIQSESQQVIRRKQQTNSTDYMEGKRLRVANIILINKNQIRGLTLPGFKSYYETRVIKTVRY